ncbi:MAG: tetratricopeptide repeat protein [Thermomicrobiales bacterium]
MLQDALDLTVDGTDRIVELNSMSQLAAAWWDLGDFERAETQARQAIAREHEYGLVRMAMVGAARTALADVLRCRGELGEARKLSESAFEIIVASGDGEDVIPQMWALHTTAMIDLAGAAAGSAMEAMEEAVRRAQRYLLNERLQWLVRGLRAHIYLMMGDVEQAARWNPLAHQGEPPVHPYLDERAGITGAWILTTQQRHDEAVEILTPLIRTLDQASRLPRLSEARLILAAILDATGRGRMGWSLRRRRLNGCWGSEPGGCSSRAIPEFSRCYRQFVRGWKRTALSGPRISTTPLAARLDIARCHRRWTSH